jgi:uncharacterized iron-regulated membrane protein
MTPATTRRLLAIHRICGLIVSLNMALFSITGALLIFHEQIDAALGDMPAGAVGTATVSLARALELARAEKPGANPLYVFRDADEFPGLTLVGFAEGSHKLADARPVFVSDVTGEVFGKYDFDGSFSGIVLKLHAQLLLGPGGSLLVGALGLLLLLSLVTGAIIYGPMMKRFAFGVLRRQRHVRTLLADVHKLLGAASFGWLVVVVATGTLLSLGSMLLQLYTMTELSALAAPYAHESPVTDFSTIDAAARSAEHASGGRHWSLVALPGSDFASPRHYSVLLKGHEGLDKRMLTMGLVDATAPTRVDHREFPWYLRALLVSEPLHFGDYGGLPLKLVWLLFTLISLAMSVSGVFVTVSVWRDRSARRRSEAVDAEPAGSEVAP